MSTAKKILKIVLVVLSAICALVSVYVAVCLYNGTVLPNISACTAAIAFLSAIYYAVRGYSKHATSSFKVYMIISALYFLGLTMDSAINITNTFSEIGKGMVAFIVAVNCLIFGLLLLLGIANDLGKAKTNFICILALVLSIAATLSLVFENSVLYSDLFMVINRFVNRVALVVVAFLMIQFKNFDKAECNAK